MTFDPDLIKQIVTESRAEQGLPPTIEDPTAIARITAMLTGDSPLQIEVDLQPPDQH